MFYYITNFIAVDDLGIQASLFFTVGYLYREEDIYWDGPKDIQGHGIFIVVRDIRFQHCLYSNI